MQNKKVIILTAAFGLGIFIVSRFLNIQGVIKEALEWIESRGVWAPVIFCLLYITATVLFLPGSILTLGAGFIFGLVHGSIYVSLASVLGASAAFLTGRYLARRFVENKIEGSEKFRKIDDAVATGGWKIVLLTRLSPVFPFNLLNYAFGLTRVSFKEYALASWIGMMPATILFVYVGSLAGSLATLGSSNRERSPAEWGLYAVGFLATLAVTIYITAVAKKALSRTAGPENIKDKERSRIHEC